MNWIKSKLKYLYNNLTRPKPYLVKQIKLPKKYHGNEYGGFFVQPELLDETSIVYSFGIGEDVSFDLEVIEHYGCKVFAFDPTPRSVDYVSKNSPNWSSKFQFHNCGIASETGQVDFFLPLKTENISGSYVAQSNVDLNQKVTVNMKTLADVCDSLGHDKIDLLKMDIEGAEYEVLENILASNISIDQILVEFHERFFDEGVRYTQEIIKKLNEKSFQIFAISDSLEEVSFARIK